jgi:tetratricopeptide (TPR) repeat protein
VPAVTSGTCAGARGSAMMAEMKILILPLALLSFAASLSAAADLAPARALMAKKDFPAAIVALETITAAEPANSEAHLVLGNALAAQINAVGLLGKAGLAKRSLAAYERAAALDPRSIGARLALVQYYKGAPFFAGGSRSKAYASARELAALDTWEGNFWLMRLHQVEPASYRALYQLGRTVALTGQQLERGVASLRLALTLTPQKNDPPVPHAHHRLGQILETLGDRVGARDAYETALRLDPKLEDARKRLAQLK